MKLAATVEAQESVSTVSPLSTAGRAAGPQGAGHRHQAPAAKKTTKKKTKTGIAVPAVVRPAYIKVGEFDSTPKYMKGRLSREHCNSAIDALHEAAVAKYRIVALPRSKIPDAQLKMWYGFKEQITNDVGAYPQPLDLPTAAARLSAPPQTAGKAFVVDEDIKVCCALAHNGWAAAAASDGGAAQHFTAYKMDKAGRSAFAVLRHLGRCKEDRGGGMAPPAITERCRWLASHRSTAGVIRYILL